MKRALLSVSDKTGLVEFASFLVSKGVELISTGGSAKTIRAAGLPVKDVSEYTGSREILDGRVKTLHPKIHGGIMNVRGNAVHIVEMAAADIHDIDMVVVNLYMFQETVAKGGCFATCIENIDIGGPSMLRSSSKNHKYVVVATNPSQYAQIQAEMDVDGCTSLALRKQLAAAGFALSAAYDTAISTWIAKEVNKDQAPAKSSAATTTRVYKEELTLKYGCNPHQSPAGLYSIDGNSLPFNLINGTPGYINLMDAVNAWQLVKELAEATGLPAAASFKHVSPAGAAVAVELSDVEKEVFECRDINLTPAATAYIRARNADPLSSFGDFSALSEVVDEATALVLKREVSDGIIAKGFTDKALSILKAKKGGKFIIMQADPLFTPPENEYREICGMALCQKRANATISTETMAGVRTKYPLNDAAKRDLVVASIAIKYTQSNSVGYAKNGQMLGIGAGQQSRVDCVKLAARKVEVWRMRFHPKVRGLPFREGSKRQDRVNARVRFIEGDITESEKPQYMANFTEEPQPLSQTERSEWKALLTDVSLASDAFFPFRDSIDHASKYGVKYIAQAGGSVQDDIVIAAANEYNMGMAFTGIRLFHH